MLPFSLVFGSMVGTSAQHAVVEDRIDPARAAALYATLGLDKQPPVSGDPLPPFFHHIYFWDPADAASLGVDGHRATHEESSQRMWAGGRLTLHRDFRAGVAAK